MVKQNKLIPHNNQSVLNLIGKFSSLAKVANSNRLSCTLHLQLHHIFFIKKIEYFQKFTGKIKFRSLLKFFCQSLMTNLYRAWQSGGHKFSFSWGDGPWCRFLLLHSGQLLEESLYRPLWLQNDQGQEINDVSQRDRERKRERDNAQMLAS